VKKERKKGGRESKRERARARETAVRRERPWQQQMQLSVCPRVYRREIARIESETVDVRAHTHTYKHTHVYMYI